MKIVCVATSQIPSDTANSIQVMKACQGIAQLDHRVHLLVPSLPEPPAAPPSWEELAQHYGLQTPFEVQWLPATLGLRRYDFAMKALREARRLEADVLYTWALQVGAAGLFGGLPVALELHGPPEGRFGPALYRSYGRLQGPKRLLPITQALVEILQKEFGTIFLPEEIVLAPNGVDLERYQRLETPAEARRKLNLPEGLTAGYTGHLYPGRGLGLLQDLAAAFPQVNFLWIGGRPQDVAHWQERLAQEQIHNVTLLGFIDNRQLPAYQAAMDILLMPYEKTIAGSGGGNSADFCSPMKMFEYLAAGRAIISSDLPVLREVLDPQVALLPPPEESPAWIEAFGNLIRDPDLRGALGTQARLRAQSFTWKARAEKCLQGFPG